MGSKKMGSYIDNVTAVPEDAKVGDSIAVNGCCVTGHRRTSEIFRMERARDSSRTTSLAVLVCVNLERPVRAATGLVGTSCKGHVDAIGHPGPTGLRCGSWQISDGYCVEKGSIAIDGASLTIFGSERRFHRRRDLAAPPRRPGPRRVPGRQGEHRGGHRREKHREADQPLHRKVSASDRDGGRLARLTASPLSGAERRSRPVPRRSCAFDGRHPCAGCFADHEQRQPGAVVRVPAHPPTSETSPPVAAAGVGCRRAPRQGRPRGRPSPPRGQWPLELQRRQAVTGKDRHPDQWHEPQIGQTEDLPLSSPTSAPRWSRPAVVHELAGHRG